MYANLGELGLKLIIREASAFQLGLQHTLPLVSQSG
jgi:hypothetical protein